MRDTDLYQHVLGLEAPWSVNDVELNLEIGRVDVWVEHESGISWSCPECGKALGCYDHAEERIWRHLDTCQYETHLHARIPRVRCPEHGVKQVRVPWAEKHSRFTMLMERFLIDLLQATKSVSRTASLTRTSWDEVQAVMEKAVARGQARKEADPSTPAAERLGVDEKAFRKGQSYMTVVSDSDRGTVEHIAEGRKKESLAEYYRGLSRERLRAIKSVAMDMWDPYVQATEEHVPLAGQKIVFDQFHVMQHATDAVNKVRRAEHKALLREGDTTLKGTMHLWLYAAENMPEKRAEQFEAIKALNLKTGRAWAIKETLRDLWTYTYMGAARRFFREWYGWARRSKLGAIKRLAQTVRNHLEGILAYCRHGVTNAVAEGLNSTIMTIKRLAGGFRNREHFKTAVYFHCGGLDLYPR